MLWKKQHEHHNQIQQDEVQNNMNHNWNLKIELDVEELGRESNLSMFKEMYGLKNYPTN